MSVTITITVEDSADQPQPAPAQYPTALHRMNAQAEAERKEVERAQRLCRNCKYWNTFGSTTWEYGELSLVIAGSNCEKLSAAGGLTDARMNCVGARADSIPRLNFFTHASFGCNQWRKKEEEGEA